MVLIAHKGGIFSVFVCDQGENMVMKLNDYLSGYLTLQFVHPDVAQMAEIGLFKSTDPYFVRVCGFKSRYPFYLWI